MVYLRSNHLAYARFLTRRNVAPGSCLTRTLSFCAFFCAFYHLRLPGDYRISRFSMQYCLLLTNKYVFIFFSAYLIQHSLARYIFFGFVGGREREINPLDPPLPPAQPILMKLTQISDSRSPHSLKPR